MLPQEQENKENVLNHASSFSCRTQEIGSKRKGKQGKEGFHKGKCNQAFVFLEENNTVETYGKFCTRKASENWCVYFLSLQ